MSKILTLENICKRFGENFIINNLSLSVPGGRIVGLLGQSGAGKTTLLKLIAGFLKPGSGAILINGQAVKHPTRSMISFLIEPNAYYPFMKIKDAIKYYKDFFPDFDCNKAIRLCNEHNLDLLHPIKALSNNNKYKVSLLLALSRKVPLYLLDEPAAVLEPEIRKEWSEIILSDIDHEAAVIIGSRFPQNLETISHEVLILNQRETVLADMDNIRSEGKSLEDFYMGVKGNGNA